MHGGRWGSPGTPRVPAGDLVGDLVEPDAAELLEVPVKYLSTSVLVEPDRLEDLRAGVGRDRRDAHLGHHLEHALAERLDQVAHGLLGLDVADQAAAGRSSTDSKARYGLTAAAP